jgi:hypothetical protein
MNLLDLVWKLGSCNFFLNKIKNCLTFGCHTNRGHWGHAQVELEAGGAYSSNSCYRGLFARRQVRYISSDPEVLRSASFPQLWRRYVLEANNKVCFYHHISFVHKYIICHAITILSRNFSTRVAYNKQVPSSLYSTISLVNWWSRFLGHGHLCQLTMRSYKDMMDMLKGFAA